ncbi:hypothetical protein QJQ45_023342, partial [Haematococcus lacustris]
SGRQEQRRGLMHLDLEMWVERLMQYFKSWVGSHAVPMNLELSVAMKEELVRKGRAEHAKGDYADGVGAPGLETVRGNDEPTDDVVLGPTQRCVLKGCRMPQPSTLAGPHSKTLKLAVLAYVRLQRSMNEDFPWTEQHVHMIFPSSSGVAPDYEDHVLFFRRAECNEEVIHSSEYKRVKVRNSTWIQADYDLGGGETEHNAAHVLFWVWLQHPALQEPSQSDNGSSEPMHLRLAAARLFNMSKSAAEPEASIACYHSYGLPATDSNGEAVVVPKGKKSCLVRGVGPNNLYMVDGESIKYKLVCCFPHVYRRGRQSGCILCAWSACFVQETGYKALPPGHGRCNVSNLAHSQPLQRNPCSKQCNAMHNHWPIYCRVLDPVNFRSMDGNSKPLPPVNQLDDEHSEHVVPEVARLAGAPYQTTLQELDNFLNSAWSSAMVRHANSILRTTRTVTVPGEPTVTYLADMDSRRAFWSVTAAEQFPIVAKAAVRLLSVHVSTAAAERNWSVWTSIYRNALRNKLSVEQAEKLVYVKANAKYETDMLAPPKDIRINIFEAAEAEAKAQAGAAEAEAPAQADVGAYEAQLHQLQADLQQREQQVADTQRLQHLQQQLQDLQQDELQRKEQQVAEQQQQLQQQQAHMHVREQQLAEQQHQVQQREQQVAQQQHQVQQQQADMEQREQQVAQQQHRVQQQQADMQQREQQVAQQQHQDQLEYVRNFFEEHSSPSPMYKDVRRYYVRMTAGSSKKSEVRMSRRYVDRSLKKLYLEYEWECPVNVKVGSTTFELLRPPWVKRITAAHKQVCVCIPCETCELLLDQLGKHMDSLVVPEDPQPPDDSDSDSESDSDTNNDGGDAEVHVVLAEHIANADAQDLAGVLDAGVLDEGGLEKLVSDAQNARAAAGSAGGGAAAARGTAGGATVRVDLDYATVQSWFVCPCKVGAKPSLACLQRKCAACKDRKVHVKAERQGVQLQYRQFKKLDNGQGVELATVQTTLEAVVASIPCQATFRAHCAAVRNTPGLVVVSCDWSEKLTIHQDIACQGAYWKQRTMSVFVACAHYQDMAGNYREESVFVSADKCDQSAEASTTALVQVIECLLQGRRHLDGILGVASNPDGVGDGRDDGEGWVGKMDMRQLCLWSDGCASQFKGAKAIRLHWHLANRFGVPVQWSYGATSHFKSTHDSEGGVAKKEWMEQMLVHPELVGKVCGAAVLTDWANKHFAVPCHAQDTSASHRQRGHIMFRRYLVLDDARQATVCCMSEADVERMHKDVKGCRAMHRMVFTPDGDQPQWAMAGCACSTCMSVPCQPCMKPDSTTPLEPMPMFQDTVKEVREDEECYALLMLFHSDLLHDEVCFGKLTNKHCERYRMHMGWKREEGRRELRRWVLRELQSEQLEAEYEADNGYGWV